MTDKEKDIGKEDIVQKEQLTELNIELNTKHRRHKAL